LTLDPDLQHQAPRPADRHYRIGAIGAGFIMRDAHLVAYRNAGYNVAAIAARRPEQAREVAQLRGIPQVFDDWRELISDPSIEVLDVAVPPHAQSEVLLEAARHAKHFRGVLAQKPFALSYREAKATVDACERAGLKLAVNQNMRFDQSIRALKAVLDRGYLGEPVLATVEMRAIPHWMPWARLYDRLTLPIMSIHHLDVFRYLFGNPASVYVSARTDPRTAFPHRDGIVLYILEYESGLRASSWDDVWAGPAREGAASDIYIKWRVEGTDGLAQGTIGWPEYPNTVPSTMQFATKRQPGCWISPKWTEAWFPDAFEGPMGELLSSIAENRRPFINARDNLHTIALLEACYRSLDEHRPVSPGEIVKEEQRETGAD
jgi:predicted dehydrogenase